MSTWQGPLWLIRTVTRLATVCPAAKFRFDVAPYTPRSGGSWRNPPLVGWVTVMLKVTAVAPGPTIGAGNANSTVSKATRPDVAADPPICWTLPRPLRVSSTRVGDVG